MVFEVLLALILGHCEYDNFSNFKLGSIVSHSTLSQFLIKCHATETKTSQGCSVFFKDSKNELHEILANRAW